MRGDNFFNYQDQKDSEMKARIVLVLGAIAYGSVLILLGAHSWNLIVGAVADEVKWVATFGFIGLEINAIALPLAIHYWTKGQVHRMAAILFYIMDGVLLYLNSTIDSALITGSGMPPWGDWYLVNVAHTSPIFSFVVWSTLFILDPTQRAKEKLNEMKAAIQESALLQAMDFVQSPSYRKQISRYGEDIAKSVVSETIKTKSFASGRDLPMIEGPVEYADEDFEEQDNSNF